MKERLGGNRPIFAVTYTSGGFSLPYLSNSPLPWDSILLNSHNMRNPGAVMTTNDAVAPEDGVYLCIAQQALYNNTESTGRVWLYWHAQRLGRGETVPTEVYYVRSRVSEFYYPGNLNDMQSVITVCLKKGDVIGPRLFNGVGSGVVTQGGSYSVEWIGPLETSRYSVGGVQ